jgi:DNA polymerase IV
LPSLCRDCLTLEVSTIRRCGRCASPRVVTHTELTRLAIGHLDCDAFYASVEKRDRPELRDLPVIVGGAKRGVVTTACYVARLSGVRSAMPMFKALKLCPQAIVIRPDFTKYRAESRRIFEKLRAATPLVQTLSLDEAWLDLSGTERLHGAPPALTLARLQGEIEREVGITVSIGLAPNRFLAKIASELDKPRGFAVIGEAEATDVLAPRPVSILPGVGAVFAKHLEAAGLITVSDIQNADPAMMAKRFGENGARIARLSRGEDARTVDPDQERKSHSAETTFEADLTALADLEDRLWPLCERVSRGVRAEKIAGTVVTLKLRGADFRIVTRRKTLSIPTQTAKVLFAVARDLLKSEAGDRAYRLIGVGLSNLVDSAAPASDLFDEGEVRARVGEEVLDKLRARFGPEAVVNARGLPREPRGKRKVEGE